MGRGMWRARQRVAAYAPVPIADLQGAFGELLEYFAERRCAGSDPVQAVTESLEAVIPPARLECVVKLLEGELDQTYSVDGFAEFERMVETCECYYQKVQDLVSSAPRGTRTTQPAD
jgi:hypothetical protein